MAVKKLRITLVLRGVIGLLIIVFFAGCTDNPILGEWELINKRQARNGLVCRNMEFTTKREVCDGLVIGVKYDVTGSGVIISQSSENTFFDIGVKVNVLSKDIISYIDPFSGKVIYYQRKGTETITPTVITLFESYTKKELNESCDGGLKTTTTKFKSQAKAQQAINAVCLAAKLK